MTAEEVHRYIQTHIPLSRHMELRVGSVERERLVLELPLGPNVNPHGTVFGGALSAIGLIGGWMLLHVAFARAGLEVKLVGKESRSEFLAPADGHCLAESHCEAAELDGLFTRFRRAGRARQSVTTIIRVGSVEVARHHGLYTALKPAVRSTLLESAA